MKNKILFLIIILLLLCQGLAPGSKSVGRLKNIRFYSYADYTRVVLDLESEIRVNEKLLPGSGTQPDRLYFDLEPCTFAADYPADKRKNFSFSRKRLPGIRIAVKDTRALRVVFDFEEILKYQKFYLTSPFRVVFDIYGESHGEGSPKPGGALEPGNTADNSLARQLGLGVRAIVIDPGHGGKDPGAINKKLELFEKEIVLDIASELAECFKQYPEYRVILTRNSDRHLSLEERTAIANSEKGDLFVSLHVNSAPRSQARGVETYFLSMTSDPWAQQVAAMENMVSEKSIAEMPEIVELMIKNAKIAESGILAAHLQNGLLQSLDVASGDIRDLGVKKAPFFVLIGARMPAALVEVSFLSNPEDAAKLKTKKYRRAIAEGLLNGIFSYIKSLGKN